MSSERRTNSILNTLVWYFSPSRDVTCGIWARLQHLYLMIKPFQIKKDGYSLSYIVEVNNAFLKSYPHFVESKDCGKSPPLATFIRDCESSKGKYLLSTSKRVHGWRNNVPLQVDCINVYIIVYDCEMFIIESRDSHLNTRTCLYRNYIVLKKTRKMWADCTKQI